jgi:hypothetical protein
MAQPTFESGARKSGAENPEASDAIRGRSTEQAAADRKSIEEKSKLRDGLRRAWKEKFEEFKAMKEEMARDQATMERLKIAGNLNLSEEEIAQSRRDGLEKVEAAGRDAEKYLNDARELEEEIEALRRGLEKGVN